MNEHPKRLKRSDFEFRWERYLAWPIGVVIGAASGWCTARADTIGVHVYTPHFAEHKDVPDRLRNSDVTPGLYWRGDSGLTLGVVRNSLRRPAVYAAYTVESDDKRWALTLGAISGYRYRAIYGQHVCREGYLSVPEKPCRYEHGKTNAHLRPLIAPSWAWLEARPYLGGATPRVILLGKGISFALEAQF